MYVVKSTVVKSISIVIIMAFCITSGLMLHANSAEPPTYIILVPFAPADLTIQPAGGTGYNQAFFNRIKTVRPHETQFVFYRDRVKRLDSHQFVVNYGEQTFTVAVPERGGYRQIYTLDLTSKKLFPNQSVIKVVSIIAARIVMTLFIEAAVLYMMGFRTRRSWLIFLVMNVLTQGFLNINLSQVGFYSSYLLLGLLFLELVIIIAELIIFLLLTGEHSKRRRALFVVLANSASLVVGGYLLIYFPA